MCKVVTCTKHPGKTSGSFYRFVLECGREKSVKCGTYQTPPKSLRCDCKDAKIVELLKQGVTAEGVAEQLSCSLTAVRRLRDQAGIPVDTGRRIDMDRIKQLILKNPSTAWVAKQSGYSLSAVGRIKRSMGIAEVKSSNIGLPAIKDKDLAIADLRASVWRQLALGFPHEVIAQTNDCTAEQVAELRSELAKVLGSEKLSNWLKLKDRPSYKRCNHKH